MKALVYTQYGPPDVLQLKEVEKPLPKEDEVLIRVQATTIYNVVRGRIWPLVLVTSLVVPALVFRLRGLT